MPECQSLTTAAAAAVAATTLAPPPLLLLLLLLHCAGNLEQLVEKQILVNLQSCQLGHPARTLVILPRLPHLLAD